MTKKSLIVFVCILISFAVFYFLSQDLVMTEFRFEYNFLIASLVIFTGIYSFGIFKSINNLFQPLHIYAFFYICICFLTPCFMLLAHEEDCHGVNVMNGCVPGTVYVILAFISFLCGYLRKQNKQVRIERLDVPSELKIKRILKTSYIFFGIACALNLFLLISIGYNLNYLFTLGGDGLAKVTGIPDNLRFLFNSGYVLLVPWLFICAYGNKWVTLIGAYLLFIIFYAYGWRFIIYIVAVSGAIVYFRTRNKQPKMSHILILGAVLFLYSTIGGMMRGAMRAGENATVQKVESDNFIYTLESNFDIYKTYYGVVKTYPSKEDFWYGQAVIASPIIMWIPRFIWADKPLGTEYPLTMGIMKSCGNDAIEGAAMASPNITEYYLDFGVVGIIIYSFILGIVCKRMLKLYYGKSLYGVIKYALFCGFLIQLINRGYMAQLVTLIVILYLPLLLYRKYYVAK